MAERIEISRDIAASPEAVYDAISDVTRMGEWSAECVACEWHEGFDAAVLGATFDGHNRNGEHEWTSQGKVVEAEPGRSFAFECSMFDFHFSTWGYRIEPTPTGCRVTEWTEDLLPDSAREISVQMSVSRTVRGATAPPWAAPWSASLPRWSLDGRRPPPDRGSGSATRVDIGADRRGAGGSEPGACR